jgi:putative endonuclease
MEDVRAAIEREKQIKGWVRRRKVALVRTTNPGWGDLSADWFPSAVVLPTT